MQSCLWTVIYLLLSYVTRTAIGFDFLSSTKNVIVGIPNFLYQNSVCRFKECCTPRQIPADYDKLERLLHEKVYGQHLAIETVMNALKSHWNHYYEPQKALTLSFHGWPGGGKNYIAGFIKESLYAQASYSKHVHHFIGRIHFPEVEKTREYQENLYNWLKGNVSRCAKQLFIFDEVDKMPPKLLNGIKPMIDYNHHVENVDYRQSIFIFLSNTGESLITEKVVELWKAGVRREDVKLQDFEGLITKGAFNEQGGFHHSDTIKSNLIDHYIPFLPLEQEHIRLCIFDQFKLRGITRPQEKHIEEVMEFVEWGPSPDNLYSKTGCKRLSQKVGMVIQKHKLVDRGEAKQEL